MCIRDRRKRAEIKSLTKPLSLNDVHDATILKRGKRIRNRLLKLRIGIRHTHAVTIELLHKRHKNHVDVIRLGRIPPVHRVGSHILHGARRKVGKRALQIVLRHQRAVAKLVFHLPRTLRRHLRRNFRLAGLGGHRRVRRRGEQRNRRGQIRRGLPERHIGI